MKDAFPFRRVLAIGAHADDVELGCGGTVHRARRVGADVHVLCFSAHAPWFEDTGHDVETEWHASCDRLGVETDSREIHDFLGCRDDDFQRRRSRVLELIERARDAFEPDCVLVHASTDTNQDHAQVHAETLRACKRHATVLGYEFPNNQLSFDGRAHVLLEEEDVIAKTSALACYRSLREQWEQRNERYGLSTVSYLDSVAVDALATTRGIQAGARYAECYEVLRLRC